LKLSLFVYFIVFCASSSSVVFVKIKFAVNIAVCSLGYQVGLVDTVSVVSLSTIPTQLSRCGFVQ